jgi:hypothetical protein
MRNIYGYTVGTQPTSFSQLSEEDTRGILRSSLKDGLEVTAGNTVVTEGNLRDVLRSRADISVVKREKLVQFILPAGG